MPEAIDGKSLRDACGHFATGVTVISTTDKDGDHGMTANAFMSVSLDPPLICVSLNNRSRTLSKLRQSGHFGVSILAEGMESVALYFAGRSDLELRDILEMKGGLPVVAGASVQLLASVVSDVPAGDHTLLIGEVRQIHKSERLSPLLFYRGQFKKIGDAA